MTNRLLAVNLDDGNRNFPVSSGYRVYFCADPNCGPHIWLLDNDGEVFVEFIMSAQQLCELEQKTMEHIASIPKKSV